MFALQTTWFILLAVLLAGYVVLDGFDLGVGVWFWFARDPKDRGAMLAAIAPVWDGNEVWLITGGGALFAAFPHVYATVFSGFYPAMMLVLFSLIFRGVSIEFRGKVASARWQRFWDTAFAGGSSLAALLLGVALGNVLRGVPLDPGRNFTGTFLSLLNPYALLLGLLSLAVVATQGALYVALKVEGPLRQRARRWARGASAAWAILAGVAATATILTQPHLLANYRALPALWALPVLVAGAIGLLVLAARAEGTGRAMVLSSTAILGLWALAGAALFPTLVPAANDASLSLTITNASSTQRTLAWMLGMALAGMPIVIGYQIWLYRAFRQPVRAGEQAGGY